MTTAHLDELVKSLSALKVTEMAQLKTMLEETWGVTAAVAAAPAAGGGSAAAVVEEKSTFDVILTSAGAGKVGVIKAVRELTGLGLVEAKGLVDAASPTSKPIKAGVTKEEAETIKAKLVEAGATVELK